MITETFYVIFKSWQWGLDRVFKRNSFQSEAKPKIWKNSECLKTRSSPKRRPLDEFSESVSVLTQWISVLVMSVSMNKPIVWNYDLSPRTSTIISSPRIGKNSSSPPPCTSMVFQVRSGGAIQRVLLNDILMNYWVWEGLLKNLNKILAKQASPVNLAGSLHMISSLDRLLSSIFLGMVRWSKACFSLVT